MKTHDELFNEAIHAAVEIEGYTPTEAAELLSAFATDNEFENYINKCLNILYGVEEGEIL